MAGLGKDHRGMAADVTRAACEEYIQRATPLDRGLKGGGLVDRLPRELWLVTTKVAISGGLGVDRT